MRVRHPILLALVGGAVAASLAAAGHRAHARPAAVARPRPNVLVLETDDQTLAEMAVLPTVRRLIGDEGVTFDNSFVTFSLCCPSRASLLTGQYAHNHGVRGNTSAAGGYYKLDSTNTLAVWLQRAGYYTVLLGKYLNEYGTRDPKEIPPGWSEWHGLVDPSTYRYYGYTMNEDGKLTTYCEDAQPPCYQTDVLRDKADEIIRRRAPNPQPFFLWVAFLAPHAGQPADPDNPFIETPSPAPRHRGAFANEPLPMPPSFNEADVSDKPSAIQRLPLLAEREIAAIRENWQRRRETLLAVDEAVGSILETLRRTGELDNTLILFTSDNGFFHGEHRIPFGKTLLYEPSIRVPLLMRGPGIPRGVHRSQLVANIDYAPTILDAAKVEPGRIQDGISLLPLARDGYKEVGRDLLVDNEPGPEHFDAIRSRNWLYAEYATGERELYDLAHDPDELQSLHGDPSYAAVRGALAQRLHVLVACKGPTCREGPRVTLVLRSRRRRSCAFGAVRASLGGTDAATVTAVTFELNGRTVAVARRAPFRVVVPHRRFHAGRNVVRARVEAQVDRLVTKDTTIRVCR
ncbi:MAG TPA: sulfatase [Gaiellaceae bacterium]